MMRNLAVELGDCGIAVNNIAPGAIQTPSNCQLLEDPHKLPALMANNPMRRLGKTEDVPGVAVFLASSEADYRARPS
jgi:glucose 1-dehydrogenase